MKRPDAIRFDHSDAEAVILAAIRNARDRMLREYDEIPEWARGHRCWHEKWSMLLDGSWVRWSPAELLGARSRRLRGLARDALERLAGEGLVSVYSDAGRVQYVRLAAAGEARIAPNEEAIAKARG